ncbi:MAG TPA: 5-methyltetrahydropteroyltriglutamate--homocysteine S-methyltransferase, partial [Rhodocyclaceae bacterium]|nr:5-methyltetrahydropteroyltriglutamate--homocysteine S-methyltransferase [Rhodocyclaceae bacterium]
MAKAHILGYPRIGPQRELKFALEAFWRNEADEAFLQKTGDELRILNWSKQSSAALDFVTCGDFAFYDQMLNHAALFGCLPTRFGFQAPKLDLRDYFALARGTASQPAMEMTKWFDTNYHYLVPELDRHTRFDGGIQWWLDEVAQAIKFTANQVKPVLIGPVSFLWLCKSTQANFDRLDLLPALIDAYARLLGKLKALGIQWVQVDEPVLALELPSVWLDAFDTAYERLAKGTPKLLLATYFDSAADYANRIIRLPVQGIHLDLVRAPAQLNAWLKALPEKWVLSAGVIDGRNIWRNDLERTLALLTPIHKQLGERLWIAPSCSLLHVPVSLECETALDEDIRPWLAFADEKIEELRILCAAINGKDMGKEIDAASAAIAARRNSRRVHNDTVQRRIAGLKPESARRGAPFAVRIEKQRKALKLPLLPTTTIGSFPQTTEIRAARATYKRAEMGAAEYLKKMRVEIQRAVAIQESLGFDVLVHGEAERNDMVEYFGERLYGYLFTANGWVQSYGSRCVKPPVIYGDVFRPEPMTVDTTRYAQSLTEKPMKGMLTGPVTMLQWSFVRDDQARAITAMQLALAIRDEVTDLERAGIRIIQIDEPAFREGLPLKRHDWQDYLDWATCAFRISSVAQDETQIHTHMCYSEFNDILPAIAAMDADVITIETSRSHMELLDGFGQFHYPNEIGPGVYDIHSPRVPS